MHYFDGTEAQLGDTIAKAEGADPAAYDGQLKAHETAVVVQLYPGADACNLSAVVARAKGPNATYGHVYAAKGVAVALDNLTATSKAFRLVARMGE